jgi:uncharacterized protein (TIGR00369 family)
MDQPLDMKAAWLEDEKKARLMLAAPSTASAEVMRGYDGLGFFEATRTGELGAMPIAETLNFFLVSVEPGRAVFQGTPLPQHYNPIGSVHGGWFAAILDSALGCAVLSRLPKGKAFTTLELKVNMIRGLTDRSGPVRAAAEVIHSGGKISVAEAKLHDSMGKLYASATATHLIIDI